MPAKNRLKIGIFFGGPSREREISFAGGRTVYDNLDKSLFEAIPIFIDSRRNLIKLDWQYIYKGTIRDFYPPVKFLPDSPNHFQIYAESLGVINHEEQIAIAQSVGEPVQWAQLSEMIDFAFLALHGVFGEDGQIQGILDGLQIPYSGSGVLASAIGMDKAIQKRLMKDAGFAAPNIEIIERKAWIEGNPQLIFDNAIKTIGFPIVIRPANQGSSIGVAILNESLDLQLFVDKVNQAFFIQIIEASLWQSMSKEQRVSAIQQITDIRDGIGFPLELDGKKIDHPESLLTYLNEQSDRDPSRQFSLQSYLTENQVILESFIHGKEFSCIVIRKEDGSVIALPPTEIIKGKEVFDYRSKYLPGLSRKETPIHLPDADIENIRFEVEKLFVHFGFNTYARIDGFINDQGLIYLNDPNTTSGMLPSSFFFHQAAEIGLNPSRFLTYIIRISMQERMNTELERHGLEQKLAKLDASILTEEKIGYEKLKIAVILGGYSFERHISVESGRNIYEKLSSSSKYEPIPVFLLGNENGHELYQIPINLLLKDNADDIRDKILDFKLHPIIEKIKVACKDITEKYAAKSAIFEPKLLSYEALADLCDGVFIALHGRPGEDGTVQRKLDALGVPYNGSGYAASQITINKFDTLQILKENGFKVAEQHLLSRSDFKDNPATSLDWIEQTFGYPFVAKPVDDGCSSAVKVIRNRETLTNYLWALFRDTTMLTEDSRAALKLHPKEEFPAKDQVLLESLISSEGASHFLEITGGLLTSYVGKDLVYEMFEPSEALAEGEILSMEEKFLAGEGQNITPARFALDDDGYKRIAAQVKGDLERAAKILGVEGYARIDAFVRIFPDLNAETVIIEVNSLPGMTPATCIFHQTAINGYKPYEFIDRILDFGKQKMDRQLRAISSN
ncbi:MAG: D-alanine--D-alanine ligase [Saprospiraceae bacterium]